MKIQALFAKPVDRPIEGVIKADDVRNLVTEVDEYVITAEIAKGLGQFAERYLDEPSANGVWISGFFGSGKSHLLKMLSIVLENRALADGRRAADIFLRSIDDQILRGDLQRAIKIPSRSILFNIDQKSTAIGGDPAAPVLEAFVKVFNEMQGYYAAQGHIAQFERDLDQRGELEAFKAIYERSSGHAWSEHLPYIETLENETFARAYAAHSGIAYEEALKLFDRLRNNYKVSIESFARDVKAYIDRQASGFRLNFFVDEVGQFIGQDSHRMLNLQTIAETLSTTCNGKAWVIVTSQGDLRSVIGELRGGAGYDFTKIEARFKTRLTLTSTDVMEIIKMRLLAKKEKEPEALTGIYDREKDNLQTLYRFGDGSQEYRRWRGSDEFCALYPFAPYQFDLFQRAIEQLSKHNNFTGLYTAVGERSALTIFQEVAKLLRGEEVGRMAAFDQIYEGIAPMLRGDVQTALRQAREHLRDPLGPRILKALFLLKWHREFKPTPRNVAILLIDHLDLDIKAHEQAVAESLAMLESQSYLQRNGDVYEFLTDIEKDIEVEIRNVDLEANQVPRLLHDILHQDVLRDPKIRFADNGQDYAYARRLDNLLVGKEADISVDIITQNHDQHANPVALTARSMGRAELLIVLPEDKRLIDDCVLYAKTNKFVQQATNGGLSPDRKAVIDQRGRQNDARRNDLVARSKILMSQATYYLNGSALILKEADPRSRFARAGQDLIAFAYPKLKMLRGTFDVETLRRILLQPDELLGAQALNESETETLTYIKRNQNDGVRLHVESIVGEFGRKPYGWPPYAVTIQLARLFRAGRIELREEALLDARAAFEALSNTRRHGGIKVRLQETVDPAKIAALKRFHLEFFDRENSGSESRSVARATAEALSAEAAALDQWLNQRERYPFLKPLEPLAARMRELAGREDAWLINQRADYADALLDARDKTLLPIKTFMNGPQRQVYDALFAFQREEEANFSEAGGPEVELIRAVLASDAPFRGNALPQAKLAMERLQRQIGERLSTERDKAMREINAREADVRGMAEFARLDETQQRQVLEASQRAREETRAARFISAVRDRLSRYMHTDSLLQMELVLRLVNPPPTAANNGGSQTSARVVPVSALRTGLGLIALSTEAELDTWLAALREAALVELKKGNRISL